MNKNNQNYGGYVTLEDVLDIDKSKSIGQILAEDLDKQISKDMTEVLKKHLPAYYNVDEEKVMHFVKAFLKAQNGNHDKSEGEWKQTTEPLGAHDVDCVECSVCGESWVLDEDFDYDVVKDFWNFCPNCGARMKGGAEE